MIVSSVFHHLDAQSRGAKGNTGSARLQVVCNGNHYTRKTMVSCNLLSGTTYKSLLDNQKGSESCSEIRIGERSICSWFSKGEGKSLEKQASTKKAFKLLVCASLANDGGMDNKRIRPQWMRPAYSSTRCLPSSLGLRVRGFVGHPW